MIDSTLLIQAERDRLIPEQFIRKIIHRWGDVELAICAMSAGELFHGCWRADGPDRRARRQEFVEALISAIPVVDIDLAVSRIFGEIDAGLRRAGRRLPTSDLLIGCTALSRGDAVVTGNVRHFRAIPGLIVHEWT